jgi:hypothetical protein
LQGKILRGDALGKNSNFLSHVCQKSDIKRKIQKVKRKIQKVYVEDHLAQSYFNHLRQKKEVKGIPF